MDKIISAKILILCTNIIAIGFFCFLVLSLFVCYKRFCGAYYGKKENDPLVNNKETHSPLKTTLYEENEEEPPQYSEVV